MQGWVSHHLNLILSCVLLQLDLALERRSSSGSFLLVGLILSGLVFIEPCWRMVLRSWARACTGSLGFLRSES